MRYLLDTSPHSLVVNVNILVSERDIIVATTPLPTAQALHRRVSEGEDVNVRENIIIVTSVVLQ